MLDRPSFLPSKKRFTAIFIRAFKFLTIGLIVIILVTTLQFLAKGSANVTILFLRLNTLTRTDILLSRLNINSIPSAVKFTAPALQNSPSLYDINSRIDFYDDFITEKIYKIDLNRRHRLGTPGFIGLLVSYGFFLSLLIIYVFGIFVQFLERLFHQSRLLLSVYPIFLVCTYKFITESFGLSIFKPIIFAIVGAAIIHACIGRDGSVFNTYRSKI